jgi:hypothetical protein
VPHGKYQGENSTKTDRPRPSLLVGPHAALCKPYQGPAQLRLSLARAAPPRLRRLPDEFSHHRLPNRYGSRKRLLEVMVNFTAQLSLQVNSWPNLEGRARRCRRHPSLNAKTQPWSRLGRPLPRALLGPFSDL